MAADSRDPRHAFRTQSEAVTEAAHDAFWRRSFEARPYADPDRGYEYYRPAYRYGWQARQRIGARAFDEVEDELEAGWDAGAAGLPWAEARPAVRDAYARRDPAAPVDPADPTLPA